MSRNMHIAGGEEEEIGDRAVLRAQLEPRYQLLKFLGQSPQAIAASVHDGYRGVDLFCKVFDIGAIPAYRREVAAAVQFKHPRVLSLSAAMTLPDGRPCLLYPFISGGTLRQRLLSNQPFGHDQVRQVLEQLLEGLHHIHRGGWIHCDLKPDNVLLRTPAGEAGLDLLIADLGSVATRREAALGRHSIATPAYSAPERIYDVFDERSDLYSLGVIGYELLRGQLPFCGTVNEVLRGHLSAVPDFATSHEEPLTLVVASLLEKSPAKRPRSAKAVLDVLGAVGRAVPSNREDDTALGPPVIHAAPAGAPMLPSGQVHGGAEKPQRIVLANSPYLLAIEYPGFTDVLHLSARQLDRLTFVGAGSFNLDDKGALIGRFGTQVHRYAGTGKNRRCLASVSADLQFIAVENQHVVWADGQQIVFCEQDRCVNVARRHTYFGRPLICHWSCGVAVTSGTGNQTARLYSRRGDLDGELSSSGGPILAMGAANDGLLLARLCLTGPSRVEFTFVNPMGGCDITLDKVSLVSNCSAGVMLVVRSDYEIWSIDYQLKPRLWAHAPFLIRQLALSPCGLVAAAVHSDDSSATISLLHGVTTLNRWRLA